MPNPRVVPLPAFAVMLVMVQASTAFAQNAAEIRRAQSGESCPRCNLFQADLANRDLKGRNFAGARLRQSDMSASVMARSSFAGADLRDLNAYGAVFTGANFAHADLINASFVGAYLQGADFRGARLQGVNFSGAQMDRASGLTQAQLEDACGDSSTSAPRGLSIQSCK